MRKDGRALDELRRFELIPDFTENPLGSVLCNMGNTKVLCTVCVETGVPRWLKGSGEGWITAEYSMLPGSTDRRSERESSRGKVGGRTMEIQRLIGRSLRAVVTLPALGERTLWVDCDVLQADGGTRTASITGGCVALADACLWLAAEAGIENPFGQLVAAVSVGMVDGQPMLDLAYVEDKDAEVDANIVMVHPDRFVEVQGTGEAGTFARSELTTILDLAELGIHQLFAEQERVLAT